MKLQQFDLIFYKGNGLISNIIKKSTHSPFSHVAMIIDKDCLHSVELDWNTPVSIQHFSYERLDYEVYRVENLTEEQKEAIYSFIMNNINTKYDWLFIFSRFFNLLFDTKIINQKSRYNCDELIYEAFLNAGIKLIDDENKLTPENLSKSKFLKKISF